MSSEYFTAFLGDRIEARGTRAALEAALAPLGAHPDGLLVFSDATGTQIDLNLTGAPVETRPPKGLRPGGPRRPGRPKLGVKSREVTLLPRHWDWLARQRGGASATLRRLVDEAAAASGKENPDAGYRFLNAIAGDRPGFEEAIRALYARNAAGFAAAMAGWPADIRAHAQRLAGL